MSRVMLKEKYPKRVPRVRVQWAAHGGLAEVRFFSGQRVNKGT